MYIIAVAIIAVVVATIYFEPWVIARFQSYLSTVFDSYIPSIWERVVPVMPALNVVFYMLGAVAVTLIAREYIVTDRYVYFAIVSYLLYFPLAGMNWSSFTTLSLFPALFLLGFYFYKIEFRWLSGIMFILAASTFLIYTLIVLISGFVILVKDKNRMVPVKENRFGISLMLLVLIMFLMELANLYFVGYYGSIGTLGYGFLLTVTSYITYAKPLFFILLLIPLITFGFFGPRLLPVSIPYFLLGIITVIAGTSPEPLVAILDFIFPMAFIGSLRWIGKKVESGIMPTETRIIRFALFSLILMNILVIVTYFPFLGTLSKFLGI